MGGCPTPTPRRVIPVSDDAGIPWLTNPQRDFLAYLTVITIQPQLKPARSHERIADALGELAERGEVLLRADDDNVWVIICGEVIVHAARDWLEWATQRWAVAESN
jgi:hypothetical protein